MERDFGTTLEGEPYGVGYVSTWDEDAKSTKYKAGTLQGSDDGESVDDVSTRLRRMFKVLEEKHSGDDILLVSHGDTLSIMQATMEEADTRQHRKFSFENCELRLLGTGPGSEYQGF
mmetsp:Transcript_46468/g.101101  ORF Transcript_46468/g.101101 Transcript_46468/m.101101 type:complete len:117 (+) Transcript_46468:74-424(+)